MAWRGANLSHLTGGFSTRFREDQSVIGSLSKRFRRLSVFGVRLRAHYFAAGFNQVMIYGPSSPGARRGSSMAVKLADSS